MFMRVNSKCAHQVRPPLDRIQELIRMVPSCCTSFAITHD